MTRRRGLKAHSIGIAAIMAFACLLVFALWRLLGQESELRGTAADNMLWTVSQAQVAAYQLDTALARARLGEVDDAALRLRYHVLQSRMDLLEAGPQQRYLARIGQLDPVVALADEIRAREAAFIAADPAMSRQLHALLAAYSQATGRAANRAMIAQLETFGGLFDQQHRAVLQVIAAVVAIFAIGMLISWRMLASLRAEQSAQISLLREREMREAYRGFVALVAHQFQTPLAAIDASMQRILRKGEVMPRDEIARRARRVRESVNNLTALMRATRESVRLDAGQIETCPTECDIVAELEAARGRQLDAHPDREIAVEIDASVPARLRTDRVLLQQIIDNLLPNAIAYSPGKEPVKLRADARGTVLHISVTDYGVGIPADEMPMLFEPFFRASTATGTQGLGMGLHLSRRLAHLLGGDLTCDSTPGHGSRFTLELPLQRTDGPGQSVTG
jgi:signal transduction histidine kinase